MAKFCIYLISIISYCSFSQTITPSDTIKMDEVEIKAIRTGSKLNTIPLNIELIEKKTILEHQGLTISESLDRVPGIHIQRDGGLASTPVIRGLSRERAPILIDGNSFVGGRIRSYTLIDPFQVERIEVIKGPASAFWGSDAVSGLINVITRKASSGYNKQFAIGGNIYSGYHSYNSNKRLRLEVEGRGNGIDFLIGGGLRNAENTSTPNGKIPNSQFESRYIDWNIGYSPFENHRFEISGKYFENDNVGFPGGLGAPGPPIVIRKFAPDVQKAINFNYTAKKVSPNIEAIGINLYTKAQRLNVDMITNVFFENSSQAQRVIHPKLDVDVNFGGAKGYIGFKQSKFGKITLGIDYLKEYRIGTSRNLVIDVFNIQGEQVNKITPPPGKIQPDSYSNSLGLFAIEEYSLFENLNILIALRYDRVATKIDSEPFYIPEIAELYNSNNSSDTENAFTGNLGVKYKLSPNMELSTNLANSFRGPDLFSKYHFADGLLPNPDLKSEKGIFYEIGYYFFPKNFHFKINFYQNYLSNLFVPVNVQFQDAPAIQNQNVGKAKLTGGEYEIAYNLIPNGSIYLNGSIIRGRDAITEEELPFMPADRSLLGFVYENKKTKHFGRFEIDYNWKQDRPATGERPTNDYALLNIYLGTNLNQFIKDISDMQLLFSVDNILDKAYQSHIFRGAPGNQTIFLAPGRSFNLSAILKFGSNGLN